MDRLLWLACWRFEGVSMNHRPHICLFFLTQFLQHDHHRVVFGLSILSFNPLIVLLTFSSFPSLKIDPFDRWWCRFLGRWTWCLTCWWIASLFEGSFCFLQRLSALGQMHEAVQWFLRSRARLLIALLKSWFVYIWQMNNMTNSADGMVYIRYNLRYRALGFFSPWSSSCSINDCEIKPCWFGSSAWSACFVLFSAVLYSSMTTWKNCRKGIWHSV